MMQEVHPASILLEPNVLIESLELSSLVLILQHVPVLRGIKVRNLKADDTG